MSGPDASYGSLQSPVGSYTGGAGVQPAPQSTSVRDPWDTPSENAGDPAISAEIGLEVMKLKLLVALGKMQKSQASKGFRDFVGSKVYSNQHGQGNTGFCAAASKQMLLKFGGVIKLGLPYEAIKRGLTNETSDNAKERGQWEYWHFNETIKAKGRPVFSHPDKLGTDAILQVANNNTVGTGSKKRLQIAKLSKAEAITYLDRGALLVVGTSSHWMSVVRDPFSTNYIYLDPYASSLSDQVLISRSIDRAPSGSPSGWGAISDYNVIRYE